MNFFNKQEAKVAIISIIIMVLGLTLIKYQDQIFKSDDASLDVKEVVLVDERSEDEKTLENSLIEAMDSQGNIVKLVVIDTRLGTGDPVKKGDVVVTNYIGATQESGRFDSSYERNTPFVFTVGAGTVIKGWDEGIVGMKVGGQRVLVIPSEKAYGNMQVGLIPPNTPLIFSLELIEIR